MIVVADSSPLRYLIVIGESGLLPAVFGEVWIPSEVLNELSAAATPESVRLLLEQPPRWLCIRDPRDEAVAAIDSELDLGERAALALAQDLKADLVLVDDAAGRRAASALGLRITGTLGVLRLAAERGLVDVPDVVLRLRQSGFYIQEALIQSAFGKWL